MAMWNPWRGCKKCSDGCLHCYIHKGDSKRNVNTNEIVKTKDFGKAIEKLKDGNYKMKSGIVYLCFSTDFLIEEADEWRNDCWKMIKERQDCTFLFLTKRIDRFMKCIPNDWEDGYDNVVVCCTIENQKNANCEIPTSHVHKYIKQVTDDITIERYLDDEHLNVSGYKWCEDYVEINKVDELVYKLFKSNSLFDGITNWNYLFNLMANQQDYLKFYYKYTTTETYYTTDKDGNKIKHTRTVTHDGWHTNPYDSDNTGKTRLYHHRYYGYKIIYENDRFKVERSPYVDDIREIINEYPYFSEDCVTEVYETFYFDKNQLKYLTPKDFDVFTGPDLNNPNLDTNESRIRSKEF